MSVRVDLDRLDAVLADYTYAYLVTVGGDQRAHVVSVTPVLTDGSLAVGPAGGTTRRNLAGHADVTLLWPPADPAGYSLIVDGAGTLDGDDVVVAPHRAVLHRRAATGGARTGDCANDCVPIERT